MGGLWLRAVVGLLTNYFHFTFTLARHISFEVHNKPARCYLLCCTVQCAPTSTIVSELRGLLGVTHIQLTAHLVNSCSPVVCAHMCWVCSSSLGCAQFNAGAESLDYNQLKLAVLQAFSETGSAESGQLTKRLESVGIFIEIHALRMALMRYHKQGLLKRERKGGVLVYSLSERGVARLRWLQRRTKENA